VGDARPGEENPDVSAPITVVIPTLNGADKIMPTLACLVEGSAEGLIGQVVIADGGSSDGIADIAEEVGADFVTAKPGRGGQLRAGAEAARGAWMLFLHADTVLDGDWLRGVHRHLENHSDKAGHFSIRFDSERRYARWTEGWTNIRARWFKLPFGDQGLLISRALYDELGGFDDIPLMEDVKLVLAIGRRRLREIPGIAVTDAVRYEREGYWKRGWRNWGYLTAYRLGVSPERLAERYRK